MLFELTERLAAQGCGSIRRDAQHLHDPAGLEGGGEAAEGAGAEHAGGVVEFETEPHVGLVRTVAVHRLAVREPWERRGDVAPERALHHVAHQVFVERQDVVFVHERHLDVELGEVGLPVGPQVLVAEAARDLEVAIDTRHHQHLLEELGRLRQGVEATRLLPGRDDVIARALGRRQRQQRRLDLHEAALVEEVPDRLGHGVPQQQRGERRGPSQVEVAVLQSKLLVDFGGVDGAVDLEGRRGGGGEYGDARRDDLDVAGGVAAATLVFGPQAHVAFDLDHVLGARLLGGREGPFGVRLDDHLRDAVAVAKIDEHQAAEVAAAVDPALEHDAGAVVKGAQFTTGVASSHGQEPIRGPRRGHRGSRRAPLCRSRAVRRWRGV